MKDTNNLLDYNVWSGTDYTENTSGINKNTISRIESTNQYAKIGEHSLKIINEDTTGSSKSVRPFTIPCSANTNYTLSLDILNKSIYTVTVRLYYSETNYTQIVVNPSYNMQTVNLSHTVPHDGNLICMIILNRQFTIFVDNMELN